MGSIRAEFHPQARCLVVGKYLVFYEVLESIVYILRILHSARDIPQTLSAKH
jgi:plasmid stabilization system protein ParE